ncbi:MAG: hypothetical protein ABIV11_08545, partial [Gemmatimonadaceae bacterium]
IRGFAAATMVSGLAACGDVLDVVNKNNPDVERALATTGDVESLIRGSFTQAKRPLIAGNSINLQLTAASFENSQTAANFGMIERSQIPRLFINNQVSDQFHPHYYDVWAGEYAAIRSASDGLTKMSEAGFTLGTAASDARAKAFANFVLGLAHATLAVTYDSAAIYDETVAAIAVQPLVGYSQVMAAAQGYFDKAIALSATASTFPADWLGVQMTPARFAQVVNGFKARYRTQVARTPAERNALPWASIIANVDAAITTVWEVVDDNQVSGFDFWMHDYMSFRGAWHQVAYPVLGMVDQSGNYQAWMALGWNARKPIVLVTPDTRFPQGATLAAQRLAPGKYYRAKTNDLGEAGWLRADRGEWRWSHYLDIRYQPYYDAANVGLPIPVMTVTEMRLIKAEGLLQLGQLQAAADLINVTRVANGGLNPTNAAGLNTSCVPKLPNGQCGNLFEMLKHEKRIEQFATVYGGWFFDSRGWGDLAQGTALHYPVPARELEVREMPLYTYGGVGGPGAAPLGTYGY